MIKAIFAVDPWGGMGFRGSLPWPHHTEDMQYFKKQTENHIVVMGRRTYDDPKMPKPLKNRITYVATNRPLYTAGTVRGNLVEQIPLLQKRHPSKHIWIIGGPEIIMSCQDIIDEMHVTHFKSQFRSDVKIDMRKMSLMMRAMGAWPSQDGKCTWTVYKNIDIFRPASV